MLYTHVLIIYAYLPCFDTIHRIFKCVVYTQEENNLASANDAALVRDYAIS